MNILGKPSSQLKQHFLISPFHGALAINSSTLLCPSAEIIDLLLSKSLGFLDFRISGFFQYVHFFCLVSFTHNNYFSSFRGICLEGAIAF